MTLSIPFDNAYAALPDRFYARLDPTPVPKPGLVAVNAALASDLGIDPAALETPEGLAVLAGNSVPKGADPLAQAYAGHQFGGWVPQLGDGRAILLGEVIDSSGIRRDIQLKGAGRTPFSRGGDGRAWLGPVLREYIVSEAMHALGIPTTRALAAVTTGEQVIRETVLPGAVLTRVADSHIRVGTFQYFAARQDTEALAALTDHVIERHYPDADGPLALLDAVVARQAELIAAWMSVGFIHGVMNTDNAHVAGITIDYGPCAFLDGYDPEKVFSSIDRHGRYAYARQPEIAVWNMAQFASCLLPLIDSDQDKAIEVATAAVNRFQPLFAEAWTRRFRAKLGLSTEDPDDAGLVTALLELMAKEGADFTNTFRGLAEGNARDQFLDRAAFDTWAEAWENRHAREGGSAEDQSAALRAANPALIPRNHRIEEAIQASVSGDYVPFLRLTQALARPFDPAPGTEDLRAAPVPEQEVRQTFCGT